MNLSLKAKLNAALACLSILLTALAAVIGALIAQNEAQLRDVRASYDLGAETVLPFVKSVLGLQLDVTQVQQYLSDVSATRALDDIGRRPVAEHRQHRVDRYDPADEEGDREKTKIGRDRDDQETADE